MRIPLDYRDLLKLLNRHKVRYLIVGAYAVIYYTEPRFTKDLDIWVEPGINNAQRVWKALKDFGAPLKDIQPEDFTHKNLVYQVGIAPVRVDIMMGIPGQEFTEAWRGKSVDLFEGIKVNIMGIRELIKSKKKTKRQIDSADLKNLIYIKGKTRKKRPYLAKEVPYA